MRLKYDETGLVGVIIYEIVTLCPGREKVKQATTISRHECSRRTDLSTRPTFFLGVVEDL